MSLLEEIYHKKHLLEEVKFPAKLITLSPEGAEILQRELEAMTRTIPFKLPKDFNFTTQLYGLPLAFKIMDEKFLIGV